MIIKICSFIQLPLYCLSVDDCIVKLTRSVFISTWDFAETIQRHHHTSFRYNMMKYIQISTISITIAITLTFPFLAWWRVISYIIHITKLCFFKAKDVHMYLHDVNINVYLGLLMKNLEADLLLGGFFVPRSFLTHQLQLTSSILIRPFSQQPLLMMCISGQS